MPRSHWARLLPAILVFALPAVESFSSLTLLAKLYDQHRAASARARAALPHNGTLPLGLAPARLGAPGPAPAAQEQEQQGVGRAQRGFFAKRAAASTAALVLLGHAYFDAGGAAPPTATPAHQALLLKHNSKAGSEAALGKEGRLLFNSISGRGEDALARKDSTAFVLHEVRENSALLLQELMYSGAAVLAARVVALTLTVGSTLLMLLGVSRVQQVQRARVEGARGVLNTGLLWFFDLFGLGEGAGGRGVQRVYLQTAREKITELEVENDRLRAQLAARHRAASEIRGVLHSWREGDQALQRKPRDDGPAGSLGIFAP